MNSSTTTPPQKKLLNKRMPTVLGLIILVIGLVIGTFFLGQGTGVFAPRATPETTPKKVRLTNVTSESFTVSFITDDEIPGFVKYGDSARSIRSQASDDRDQLTGTIKGYQTHHITVRGLQPNQTYYYVLGTGSGATFDNNGQPFTVKTAQRSATPPSAKTVYGSVTTSSGAPADGALVYISIPGAGDMSAQVKSSGNWAIPLSNARKTDGSDYALVEDSTQLGLLVQGGSASEITQSSILVSEAQPIPTITLGQDGASIAQGDTGGSSPAQGGAQPNATQQQSTTPAATVDSTQGSSARSARTGALTDVIAESISARDSAEPTLEIVDVTNGESEEIQSTQPQIVGTLSPDIEVTVTINSETEIVQQVTTDSSGRFSIDLASLGLRLEPGLHTVTYAYTDPTTSEQVTRQETFTITASDSLLAQASASPQPYGTANPYPIDDATQSATPQNASPTPSPSTSPSPSISPSPSTATTSATPSPSASVSATPSPSPAATDSGRVSIPSTESGVPVSGSVGTTMALIIGGIFFIVSGLWSFWISSQLATSKET